MPNPLTPGNAAVGTDPLVHMSFLIHAPERLLALRLALSRVIAPGSVVLDAGCGSLGVLAILAAKLGAARVVGIDLGPLDLARDLARENGVGDRVQFVRSDLHDVRPPITKFDVIVGMVYNNDIAMDLAQQRLIARLVERFGHASTAVVPNRVRYSAAGYDTTRGDRSDFTRRIEWDTHIGNVEREVGMTFGTMQRELHRSKLPSVIWPSGRLARTWARVRSLDVGLLPLRKNSLRYYDRTRMTLLTRPELVTEIDYRNRSAAIEYPPTVSLPVTRSGRLKTIVWQQDLLFDDLLIRSSESSSAVDPPQSVEPGDAAIIQTGTEWKHSIPVVVKHSQNAKTLSRTRG